MEKLIFSLVLLLTTKIIYLITGRNRRQIARIPKGMAILCQPPGQRYVAYAVGVFQLLFCCLFPRTLHKRRRTCRSAADVEPARHNLNLDLHASDFQRECGRSGLRLF